MGYLLCAMWVLVMVGVGGWWFGVCGFVEVSFFEFFCASFCRVVQYPLRYMIYYRILGHRYCEGPICTL